VQDSRLVRFLLPDIIDHAQHRLRLETLMKYAITCSGKIGTAGRQHKDLQQYRASHPLTSRIAVHPLAIPLAMMTTSAYSRLYGQLDCFRIAGDPGSTAK
jgi:hypothetical protein